MVTFRGQDDWIRWRTPTPTTPANLRTSYSPREARIRIDNGNGNGAAYYVNDEAWLWPTTTANTLVGMYTSPWPATATMTAYTQTYEQLVTFERLIVDRPRVRTEEREAAIVRGQGEYEQYVAERRAQEARQQEYLDDQQRRREEAARVRLEAQRRQQGAQERALELLEALLTPEEAAYRAENRAIRVRGSDGGLYVIREDYVHGNIHEVDEHGCNLANLCVAPEMYDVQNMMAMPNADGWIGQYLAIKFNEAHLRATANFSHHRTCRQGNPPEPERVRPVVGDFLAA